MMFSHTLLRSRGRKSAGSVIVAAASVLTPLAHAADAPVQSVPYTWKNVKVGGGGFIPGIVFSRAEKGLAYLRSDMGGCYRWDDKASTWVPLEDALAESSYQGGESIAPDPVDPNVVYVAAGMYRDNPAAILRSTDRGATWTITPVPFKMGGNEDGRGLGERLAVDPASTNILYFGSRHDGLQRSTDHARTWRQVESFPLKGLGTPTWNEPTHGGLSFVVFAAADHPQADSPTKTIFVGSADPGPHHLYRSDDAGATWNPVPGEPRAELLPAQAQYDERTRGLYITYTNNIGPNGVTDGAVMKLDVPSNSWTDITPDKRPNRPKGGYMGLSLDRQHPGTLAVATMNRWSPTDTVWRTTDDGKTWHDIAAKATRDVSTTPFLKWGQPEAKLGWWMAALAIDPSDSDHVAYATGATVFSTHDFSDVSRNEPTRWTPWVAGIEQTAIITLTSPATGPHLLSGFGDIGGFAHDDLAKSPPGMYENPRFNNTNTIDRAGANPNVVVRSGNPGDGQADLGYSEDAGHSWQPLVLPGHDEAREQQGGRRHRGAHPAIITTADGSTFIVATPTPRFTRDRGRTWHASAGLPTGLHPVADRVDPAACYALDFASGHLYASSDGGAKFSASDPQGLPSDLKPDEPTSREAAWPLQATPDRKGDLWLVSKQGLYHSGDTGRTWTKTPTAVRVEALSFGKAPAGSDFPALFAIGAQGQLKAIWRSDDAGKTWLRVNDDRHHYGTRFRCISGDPRVFGRVYVGTDGRGIVYGQPVAATP